jgi:hypothetical protein
MIMMPYGRCRSSLQLTGTQTSGIPTGSSSSTPTSMRAARAEVHDQRTCGLRLLPRIDHRRFDLMREPDVPTAGLD